MKEYLRRNQKDGIRVFHYCNASCTVQLLGAPHASLKKLWSLFSIFDRFSVAICNFALDSSYLLELVYTVATKHAFESFSYKRQTQIMPVSVDLVTCEAHE